MGIVLTTKMLVMPTHQRHPPEDQLISVPQLPSITGRGLLLAAVGGKVLTLPDDQACGQGDLPHL